MQAEDQIEEACYPIAHSETMIPLNLNPISVQFEEDTGSHFEGYESRGVNLEIS